MEKAVVIVEHTKNNLSAYIDGLPIIVVGNSLQEIEKNMREAISLYIEDNDTLPLISEKTELVFELDASTFLNYYSGIFTKAALSRITGINERQLWHYASGMHKPRKRQTERIQSGVNKLIKELQSVYIN